MIIYKATNLVNGNIYIGQTIKSLAQRKSAHIYDARNGSSIYFARALRKYGFESFKWEAIQVCKDIDELNKQEVYYIALYDSFGSGYNLTSGGEGCIVSDETKDRLRQISLNISDMTRQKMSKNNARYWKGKKLSKETIEKNRQAHLGKISSDETRKRMRIASKKYWAKVRAGLIIRKEMSNEQKEKIRQANLGKKHSEESKQKIRQVSLGRKHTPEAKEKCRQAALKRWAKVRTK